MPAVEYDDDAKAPRGRSQWIAGGVLAAVVLLVLTRGMVTVLVLALLAVLVGLVAAIGYAAFTKVRGKVPDELSDEVSVGVG